MTVEAFLPSHVREIGTAGDAEQLFERSDCAYTVRNDAGEALVCGGVVDLGAGRGLVWSFVSPKARRYPKLVHGAALRFISTLDYRRLEATCRTGFDRGCRWLAALGFDYEGTMRSWGADGVDYDLYARVKRV